MVPLLLGSSFQKQEILCPREPTTKHSSHQNAGFSIRVFKNFPGVVIPRTLTAGGGDPLAHPTPSPAFSRARGASAPVLGPKPWSPSTFQPWLRHAHILQVDVFHLTTACCDWLAYRYSGSGLFFILWISVKCGGVNGASIITLHRSAGGRFTAPRSISERRAVM